MATLEKIRQRAVLVSVIVAVALLAFIVGDGLRSGSSLMGDSKQNVLVIGGSEKVKIQQYEDRLKVMQESLRAQAGNQGLSDRENMMLNNQLMQMYVSSYATKELSEELGVSVTAKELSDLIYGTNLPQDPIAQQFFARFGVEAGNVESISQILSELDKDESGQLSSLKLEWAMNLDMIRQNRLQQKIAMLLARSYKLNDVDRELMVGNQSREVSFVRISPDAMTDVTVSEEEIKAYYDSHKALFADREPVTEVNLIYTQVVPSAEDYRTAEQRMEETRSRLEAADTPTKVEDAVREYPQKFNASIPLTPTELQSLGLSTADLDFVKTAPVGSVNEPMLVDDRYTIVKVVGKDQAPESVSLNIIALDSLGVLKADSLLEVINSGKETFAAVAAVYSQDPNSKETGGKVALSGQYGQVQDSFSEFQLVNLGIENPYKHLDGRAFIQSMGASKVIVKLSDAKPNVERYQFALVSEHVDYSEETYNNSYAKINTIFSEAKTFAEMKERAEKEGLRVLTDQYVTVSTPEITGIPSSRQVVSWALNAEKDQVSDKLFSCGQDYLVIAATGAKEESGFLPLSRVSTVIKSQLLAEKQAEALVAKLKKEPHASLEEYAAANNVSVETLVGVTGLPRGEGAAFSAMALETPIDRLSAPFVSADKAYIVQPTKEEENKEALAEGNQLESSLSRQISFQAFKDFLDKIQVEDNRARFY